MILITGATGYLAGKLAYYLKLHGHKIKLASSKKDLLFSTQLVDCEKVYIDLTNSELIQKALTGCTSVIHCASMDYDASIKNPSKAREINEDGTQKIVEIVKNKNIKKFIYLSTMHVYGSNLKGQVNESTITLPENLYSETHLNSEKIINDKLIKSNTSFINIRLSNVISSPLEKNSSCWKLAFHDICLQSILNRKIELNTDGSQFRDFVSIKPLQNVIKEFIEQNKNSGTYNLGCGNSITILELAEKVSCKCNEMFNFKPEITYSDIRKNNLHFTYQIKKIKNHFNCNFEDLIEDEIKTLLQYCNAKFL